MQIIYSLKYQLIVRSFGKDGNLMKLSGKKQSYLSSVISLIQRGAFHRHSYRSRESNLILFLLAPNRE